MIKIYTLFAFLLFALPSIAQIETIETHASNWKHEFGINATNFINLFFSFNDNNALTNNYLLTYKRTKDDKKVIRMGIGLRGNHSIDNPDDDFSNFDKRTSSLFDLDYRLGVERQFSIKGKWSVNAGIDWIVGYRYDNVNTDENKVTRHVYYTGGGPVGGIQFMINERIGLLTETSLYFRYSGNIEKSKFDNNSIDESTDKGSFFSFGTSLPTNLIFFVRF